MNEPRNQQALDEIVYEEKLMEDTIRKLAWDSLWRKSIAMDGDLLIEKATGEVLSPEVDYNRKF